MDTTPRLRGIVLDLDDTLYFERDYVKSGFLAVGRALSNDPLEARHYGEWLIERAAQAHDGRTFNHLLEAFPNLLAQANISDLIQIYREHFPMLTLSEEWQELLMQWRRQGIFLGLISDGELIGQQRKVDALSLDHLLDHLILTDVYGKAHWKPSSKAFENMQEESGLNGCELIYIGDNVLKDFVAPNALNWRSLRLRMPEQIRYTLEPADSTFAAKTEADSIKMMSRFLEGWF